MNYHVFAAFMAIVVILAGGCGANMRSERFPDSGSFDGKTVQLQTTEPGVKTTASSACAKDLTNNKTEQKMDETKDDLENDMEVQEAIKQFKTDKHDRREPAKTLLPLLKKNMSMQEVEAILDMPDARIWDYTLFYSSTLIISFDIDEKVTKVSSDLLDEVGSAGKTDMKDPEITGAISEFKGQPYDRQKAARTLIPLIKVGLPIREVEKMLGSPDGVSWEYCLLDSSTSSLIVRFSNDAKVEEITSTGLNEI